MSYQRITIMGNLGRDPEVRDVNGKDVANFSVAVTEKWSGGEHTEWFNVQAWEALAGVAERFLRKGKRVLVDGTLRTRKYTTKDGEERSATELRAQSIKIIDWPEEGDAEEEAPPPPPRRAAAPAPRRAAPARTIPEDDDIPF